MSIRELTPTIFNEFVNKISIYVQDKSCVHCKKIELV
ncbi:DUF4368 domain-containing protein [Claveliimonas bilis]